MKNLLFIICTLLSFNANTQTIDPSKSLVTFEISNFGFKTVEGAISDLNGTVDFNTENLDVCRFDVCIDASTIDTGNIKRDEHLMEEEYFQTDKYPTICFYSEDITKTRNGYAITGNLTMKGVDKIATINFTHSDGIFDGKLIVDRFEYGIGSDGSFMIGREVEVSILAKMN